MAQQFLEVISPSIKFLVIMYQSRKILQKLPIFKDIEGVIEDILHRLEINFYQPEFDIIIAGDTSNRHLYLTGAGICQVFRNIDSKKLTLMETLKEGTLINEVPGLFETSSIYTMKSLSYCTISSISFENMKEVYKTRPKFRRQFENHIFLNPFDTDRDYFVL